MAIRAPDGANKKYGRFDDIYIRNESLPQQLKSKRKNSTISGWRRELLEKRGGKCMLDPTRKVRFIYLISFIFISGWRSELLERRGERCKLDPTRKVCFSLDRRKSSQREYCIPVELKSTQQRKSISC